MELDKWISLAVGFAAVFAGSAIYNKASKKINGRRITDFQSFLFGTGFTYLFMTVYVVVTFFFDYYIKGSALQGYHRTPVNNTLFFAIFGKGLAGEAQYPIMDLDLKILCCMIGCALGGGALVLYRALRNRKQHTPEYGLLYGWTFPKTTFKAYFKNELRDMKAQLHPIEYLCWWALRLVMIYVLIKRYVTQGYDTVVMQLAVNLVATFVIPLVRILFFGKLFFGKINLRVQSYIDIFVCFGSLIGQGFGLNGEIREYDKILHLVSGGVAVFIAFCLIEGTRNGKTLPKFTKSVASMGFSCTVIVVWEIFEFFTDFLMPDSYNQNFYYDPPADMFFFKLFGFGAENPGQLAVLDTDMDMLIAFFGCIVCGGALLAYLTVKEKTGQKNPAERRSMLKAFSLN